MRDILLQHGERYVECVLKGHELTFTYSDEPRCHYVRTLRDPDNYTVLKKDINELYESYDDPDEGYLVAEESLETSEWDELFEDDASYLYFDIRERDEIYKYFEEAADKVWLMRSCLISKREPTHEVSRSGMERIFNTYDDIPVNGYSDWECGYWNGIMSALRWVLGNEKDFFDT